MGTGGLWRVLGHASDYLAVESCQIWLETWIIRGRFDAHSLRLESKPPQGGSSALSCAPRAGARGSCWPPSLVTWLPTFLSLPHV